MEAPKLPSFIKQNRHRTFEFKPRFYNEREERLNRIKEKYQDRPQAASSESMREKIQDKWRNERSGAVKQSNFRLLAIIGILFLLTYLILRF